MGRNVEALSRRLVIVLCCLMSWIQFSYPARQPNNFKLFLEMRPHLRPNLRPTLFICSVSRCIGSPVTDTLFFRTG